MVIWMKKWSKIVLWTLVAAVALAVSGCGIAKIRELRVTSVGVKYIVPTSSRSMDAVLLLGLDNPSINFTVEDVRGTVRYYEREMVHFTAGELPVQARSVQVYELPCTAVLAEKVSLLDLLSMAARRSREGLTVDVKLRVKLKNGAGTTLTFNDIDLSSFSQ